MKSQLQRILNSDLSEYKIAVSDHINNINHFQQCLSQRSAFMENFNQFLQKQLQRINNMDDLTQFDAIQLDNPISTNRGSQVLMEIFNNQNICVQNNDKYLHDNNKDLHDNNKYLPYNNKYLPENNKYLHDNNKYLHDNTNKQNTKRNKNNKYNKLVKYILKNFNENIGILHIQIKNIKKYIVQEIKQTKLGILQNYNQCIQELMNKNKMYQNKCKELEQNIRDLQQENQMLRESCKNVDYQLKIESNDKNNSSKILFTLPMQQNKVITNKIQNQNQFLNFYQSPIAILNSNHLPTIQTSQLKYTTTQQQPDSFKKYLKSQPHLNLNPNLNPNSHLNQSKPTYPTNYYQSQHNPQPMKIQNKNQINWKHYICDLKHTTMKQTKTKINYQNTNKIYATLHTDQYQYQNYQNNQSRQVQPNLPILLRKNINDKSYDIPAIRSIIISYPPVQQGFAILKLGNDIVYKGMWKHRKFHGKGKLMLPDYQYQGDFQYGLFNGRGVLKIAKLEFIGSFVQNKAQGEGLLKIGSKSISGRWKNSCFIQKL